MNTGSIILNDLIKLLVSGLLGACIGFDRERRGHKFGIRTNMIVCISSALITVISIKYFNLHGGAIDPFRLSSQAFSAIGLLCGSAILRSGQSVKGITTATSLFATYCIGIGIGMGFYAISVIATVLVTLTLQRFLKVYDKGNSDE